MKRHPWSTSSGRALPVVVLALAGLATAAGCKSTSACNPGTVQLAVTFNVMTVAADSLDVQVSVNGAAPKTTTLPHTSGSANGSIEVDFPDGSGYPQGERLDVTIVAKASGSILGTATGSVAMLPSGCGTLAIIFGAPETDGGTGGSGGLAGQGGHAGGGSGGAGARDGGGETDGPMTGCASGDTRSCAADGYLGNCASGTETCAGGKWSACSIQPMTSDSCATKGDDANCNGIVNDGCTCVIGDTQPCGPAAVGICKPGTATCTNGVWGACVGAVNPAPRDCTSALDNNCDGVVDNAIDSVCQCASGKTQACGAHPGLDGNGPCKAGAQTCVVASDKTSSSWGTCTGSVGPAGADTCVQGNDNNCNGTPNDGCLCINNVTTKACGYCNNGKQTCVDGTVGSYTSCSGATGQPFTALTLQNGWTGGPYSTALPAAALDCNGIVQLKGGMSTTGTTLAAFTLPSGLVPGASLFIPADGYASAKVRLYVSSAGVVTTQAQNATTDTTSFTSLEGVSFPVSSAGYTPLTLLNGWATYPGARTPAVANVGGIIRFQGAVSGGTTTSLFTLPAGMAPPTITYVTADLYLAAKGRLIISPSGSVSVQAQNVFSDAQSFTSLEGAWFALDSTGYTALADQNGWATYSGTRGAAVSVSNGIVRFQGAISTSGTSLFPFTLPGGFLPALDVYTPVDLCAANKGRLHITPSGVVDIEPEGSTTTNATCFTSLEGVSFAQ